VYLSWKRGEKAPVPVGKIWNSKTGETTELYQFPDCKIPLPVIRSFEDMKVCPFTGDKNFKVIRKTAYD